jgi:hypothetical protein
MNKRKKRKEGEREGGREEERKTEICNFGLFQVHWRISQASLGRS